ncbi:CUB domain-containing protein 1 [Osmerus eperlanus]|uniref:CUB domain-containing protein 1 n=1 Tax=Osmerus eperlanus TaxID=29151 RepID=UPI002E1205BA
MRLFRTCASVLLGILTSLLFNRSECQPATVNPDMGTSARVSTSSPLPHPTNGSLSQSTTGPLPQSTTSPPPPPPSPPPESVTTLEPREDEVTTTVPIATTSPPTKKGRTMSVTPDPNTIVFIRRDVKGPNCQVCVGEDPDKTCNAKELVLRDASITSVSFTCLRPQDVFKVEINREIDCTEVTCSNNIVRTESLLFPDFNRTFTWDPKIMVTTRAFQLDFPEPGMRQIPNSETCPDEHMYHIIAYQRTGPATIGTFCRDGGITRIQVLYKGRVSLEVPGDRKLEPVDFKVSVGPQADVLATIQVALPRGVSNTDFISANYPKDFPSQQKMSWDFLVPGMHSYTIIFPDVTSPQCLKNQVGVEYLTEGKKAPDRTALMDPQPAHRQGNFAMTLQNCETNRTVQGLRLSFRISVMRSGHPVLCTVDLTQKRGLTLSIAKRGSDPYCEMSKDSVVSENITIPSGTKASLSFLDCPSEDLFLTATETIVCKARSLCPDVVLAIPGLDTCLPMPLQSFSWDLQVPVKGTVGLQSPEGTLRHSLPGQECNGTVSLLLTEKHGVSMGHFCPGGIISKVQVRSSVTVTASSKDLSLARRPLLNATFTEEISDSIIYSVSPRVGDPSFLATPNWPGGMAPSSTIAWIVSLPDQCEADLRFINISQPKCEETHTCIRVQTLGSLEEMLSRREDEAAADKLLVSGSFYLNMTNCLVKDGQFSVLTRVTVQKKSSILLSIILGSVGALLLLLIALAVICLVIKKRRTMIKEPSIYIGKGNIFLPGDGMFPKTRADNDSHVYASIDETMVYGHLLQDQGYMENIQEHIQGIPVDSYRTFTGQVDIPPVILATSPEQELDHRPEKDIYRPFLDPAESFHPARPRTPIGRQDSLGFEDRRMVDNELYTFKNTGDINKIRLSAELQPEPGVDGQDLDWEDSM